jgi:actin
MLAGKEIKSYQDLVFTSVSNTDIDVRRMLYDNIVLSGGTTMFAGIGARLQKELGKLVPATMRTKVVASPERKFSVWIGGSILSSLSSFQNSWITR